MDGSMATGIALGMAMSSNNDNVVHASSTAADIGAWIGGIALSLCVLLFLWGCCYATYSEFRQRKHLKNASACKEQTPAKDLSYINSTSSSVPTSNMATGVALGMAVGYVAGSDIDSNSSNDSCSDNDSGFGNDFGSGSDFGSGF